MKRNEIKTGSRTCITKGIGEHGPTAVWIGFKLASSSTIVEATFSTGPFDVDRYSMKSLVAAGKLIPAIKLVRKKTGAGPAEAKQQQLAQHFVNYPREAAEYHSGSNGQGVYSIFLFKLFPELLPEIWGTSQGFEGLGFAPTSALPLGLSASLSLDEIAALDGQRRKMTLVGTTCASCHTGQVRTPDGLLQTIWGAPSNRIQNPLVLFAKGAVHPNMNADAFRELARKRTADYFFGKQVTPEQVAEFEFFKSPGVAEALVDRIKTSGTALIELPHARAECGIRAAKGDCSGNFQMAQQSTFENGMAVESCETPC